MAGVILNYHIFYTTANALISCQTKLKVRGSTSGFDVLCENGRVKPLPHKQITLKEQKNVHMQPGI